MTLGLLLPQSSLYPTLPFDLVDGLRAGLAEVGLTDAKLVIEGIDFGTNAQEVQTKAQKLLLQEGVDVVIGMLSRRVADTLEPTFAAANRLLLVLDVVGEFFSGEAATPHIYYHSLQTCAGTWLAGHEAAQEGPVIQAASFYEAGYLPGYALAQGVAAGGSQIGQYAITPLKAADVTLDLLRAGIEQGLGGPASGLAVVALYSGDMAEQFFDLYAALPIHPTLPLWGGPMLLEEQMLAKVPFRTEGIRGYVAWSKTLANPRNDRFQEALRRRGRHPNLFSLLAYEMASYLQFLAVTYPTDPAAIEQFATLTFESPRGPITINTTTHYSSGPMYPATIVPTNSGHTGLSLGTPISTNDPINHLLTHGRLDTYANWFNTYLCI